MFAGAAGTNAHGSNERIRVRSVLDGRLFLQALVDLYTRR